MERRQIFGACSAATRPRHPPRGAVRQVLGPPRHYRDDDPPRAGNPPTRAKRSPTGPPLLLLLRTLPAPPERRPCNLREPSRAPVVQDTFGMLAALECDLRLLRLSHVSAMELPARDFLVALASFQILEYLTLVKAHMAVCPRNGEDAPCPCIPSLRVLRLEESRLGYLTESVLATANITELRYVAVQTEPDQKHGRTILWGDSLRPGHIVYHPAPGGSSTLGSRLGLRVRLELVGRFHEFREGSTRDAVRVHWKHSGEVVAGGADVGGVPGDGGGVVVLEFGCEVGDALAVARA
ncbi:hypothetical protein LXA43DRAFT_1002035 [Ganoderma leucocontextum]|nr:hypothetical protein LXA43DRAFT_1002035 [Ganoderma leucocontextum]